MSRPAVAGALLALAAAGTAGCGAAGYDGRLFRNDELSFRFGPVPPTFREVEAAGALIALRDDAAGTSVAVNGRCGQDGDDVPLEALTHHLFLHFTDRSTPEHSRFELDGREALLTDLRARLDGVPRAFSVVVLKKDGCVYDFLHVAPADGAASSRDAFLTLVRGFRAVRP